VLALGVPCFSISENPATRYEAKLSDEMPESADWLSQAGGLGNKTRAGAISACAICFLRNVERPCLEPQTESAASIAELELNQRIKRRSGCHERHRNRWPCRNVPKQRCGLWTSADQPRADGRFVSDTERA